MALRAAKGDEDATQPVWGGPSGLQPGFRPARNFTSAGSAGDLVAGVLTNRVFDRAIRELSPQPVKTERLNAAAFVPPPPAAR